MGRDSRVAFAVNRSIDTVAPLAISENPYWNGFSADFFDAAKGEAANGKIEFYPFGAFKTPGNESAE
jgi:hypothetical protein